jgi:signal transduction histidine kinase
MSLTLIFGLMNEFLLSHQAVSYWHLFDSNKELIAKSGKSRGMLFDFSKKISLSNNDFTIMLPIKMDEQNLNTRKATLSGYIGITLPVKHFLRDSIVGIKKIPSEIQELDKIILDFNIPQKSGKSELVFYLYLLVAVMFSTALAALVLRKNLFNPLRELTNNVLSKSKHNIKNNDNINEIEFLGVAFDNYQKELEYSNLQKIKNSKLEAYKSVSKQVAHDIRSPLAALDTAIEIMDEIKSENKLFLRSAVNRLHDITNNLLTKHKMKNSENYEHKITKQLVSSHISSIVTEKRHEYRNDTRVDINFEMSKDGYGAFAMVNPSSLMSILSNLINNAVESILHKTITVNITLQVLPDSVIISIFDNGKGIPEYLLDKVFEKNFTWDKLNGTGIGLSSSREIVQSWGGDINISSKVNKGTCVTITLSRSTPPSTFPAEINLNAINNIVIVDDDESIHKSWVERLKKYDLPIKSCKSLKSARLELSKYNDESGVMYLVDYEYANEEGTGLDLIEDLEIMNDCILVTSRYEEEFIRNKCTSLNIKLMDKRLLSYIPVHLS